MGFTQRRIAPIIEITLSSTTLSTAVDLGKMALVGFTPGPLVSSGGISLHVASASSGTYTPLQLADLSGPWEVTSGTTVSKSYFVPDSAPYSFIKVLLDTTQNSSATFTFSGRG